MTLKVVLWSFSERFDWPVQSVCLHYVSWKPSVVRPEFEREGNWRSQGNLLSQVMQWWLGLLTCLHCLCSGIRKVSVPPVCWLPAASSLPEWKGWNFNCEFWMTTVSFWYLRTMFLYLSELLKKKI